MKRTSGALCWLAFLLFLCVLHRFSIAVEVANDNKTTTTVVETNLSTKTMAPPDSIKTVEENVGSHQEKRTQGENEKDNGKEQIKGSAEVSENGKEQTIRSSTEKKDEPMDKSKSGNNSGDKNDNSKSLDATTSMGDSHFEDCDPSNRCSDEKNKLVACLRVPGKDSLDLSLLIQNKGQEELTVKIVTPDAVKLEETTVVLQGKGNKEVKVSIDGAANDTTITLNAGDGNCKLSYSSTIPESARQTSRVAGYVNLVKQTSMMTMIVAAGAITATALLCVRFWKTRRQEGTPKYQKLDMSLPVSTGGAKKGSDETDGWDDNWGDDWDDEETPKTPTKPVSTPSSKGLASRKLNKDCWKD